MFNEYSDHNHAVCYGNGWHTIMLEALPDVLNVEQLAEVLNVGLNTAYSLVRSENIPSVRVGKQIRISKIALLKFLHSEV